MVLMTDLELMSYSIHVHYEIDMLTKLGRHALSLRGQPAYQFDLNVLVESYAIHLRNLFDFLYKSPVGDDVGAVHYVRDAVAWASARGPEPPVLVAARVRVGKQIAHLTRRRYADGAQEKTWHPKTEIPALVAPLVLFAAHADPLRLHSEVSKAIERLSDLYMGIE
jgi:hypothetical protein